MNVQRSMAVLLTTAMLPAVLAAQSADLEYHGAQAVGLTLRRLATTHRVLMIGAHPDDENTSVLAALALGAGADVAYLSLTRGEGGQNGIGPELQEGLGLIRTDELLAARRLDGATQYFTRAYDFGFSKSAEETLRFWQRDSVLADVVAVIRTFRPDIVLSIWSGTPQDGHGHHQAAGILAREAFDAAADPARFASQLAAGLRPHRAHYLYQSSWRAGNNAALFVETGNFDELFGRSHHQIAMASRSLHRSQNQGSAEEPGPHRAGMIPMSGPTPAAASSIFDGIQGSLSAHAATNDAELIAALREFERSVIDASRAWNPMQSGSIVSLLETAYAALRRADSLAQARGGNDELHFRIQAERVHATEAWRLAAGVVFDATVDDGRWVPGDSVTMTLQIWNGGESALGVTRLAPSVPASWRVRAIDDPVPSVTPGQLLSQRFRVYVHPNTEPSQAYFLKRPRTGAMYQWPADPNLRSLPFDPPSITGVVTLERGSHQAALWAPATYVAVDETLGEARLPVLVVPAVSVRVEPGVLVLPLETASPNGANRRRSLEVNVRLRAEASNGIAGHVRLETASGWTVQPQQASIRFNRQGELAATKFTITPIAGATEGRHLVRAVFESENGQQFRDGYTIIDYPHTPPRLMFGQARATVSAFQVAVPANLRVGYIEGAGDSGPDALAQLGIQFDLLGSDSIIAGDLSQYDAIIAGIRAYEVRPDLVAANRRLLEWVVAGGTFIVQYQRQEFVAGGFAPFRLGMARSADRVTDETANVSLLVPDHPALIRPNRIGPSDFEGWIQERGLYFMSEWDDRYTPLLALNDPGEPPRQGSLLVARHGQGHYVYLALSLFRQFPEGVPGAYRLLANLVALGVN